MKKVIKHGWENLVEPSVFGYSDAMIYFTADSHFGHANIIKYCNRPFESVQQMDETMLENWNDRIKANDEVYIVGDLMFFCKDPQYYLNRLNGRKHLIIGNHDTYWFKKIDPTPYFQSISPLMRISDGSHRIILCHYPLMSWEGIHDHTYLIYGHIHNSTNGIYWPLLKTYEHALNAGVDINAYQPVTFKELVKNNRRFKENH